MWVRKLDLSFQRTVVVKRGACEVSALLMDIFCVYPVSSLCHLNLYTSKAWD